MAELLHVGNISREIDDQQLHQLFAQAGRVTSARIVTDSQTQEPQGFALVEMATPEDSAGAVAALHGRQIGGQLLTVCVLPPPWEAVMLKRFLVWKNQVRATETAREISQWADDGAPSFSGGQQDLERDILRQIQQDGSCYARDEFLDAQLGMTTEEQTMGWTQGFCARAGLTCRPYQEESDLEGRRLGTIFVSVP
jgi:hypothetical protein